MTIQSLTGKANNVVLPSKSSQKDKVEKADIQSAEHSKDTVDITAVAKEITKTFDSSETSSLESKERVSAIKSAIANGSYSINAGKIAKQMIQMEQDQFIDS